MGVDNPTQEAWDSIAIQALEALEYWGLPLIQQGFEADPKSLLLLIRFRDNIGKLRVSKPVEYLRLQMDELFDPHRHTLLYLPDEKAPDVVDVSSWHGIHQWALTKDALPYWTEQVREAGLPAHRAAVSRAVQILLDTQGPGFHNTFLIGEHSKLKKRLEAPEVELLCEVLRGNIRPL
jgi:hypothetical protein